MSGKGRPPLEVGHWT